MAISPNKPPHTGREYSLIQSQYLLYLVNHWKEHQPYINTCNPTTFKKITAFTILMPYFEKMHLADFSKEGANNYR